MGKRFFIDASNLTGAGAVVVGMNLLRFLCASSPADRFLYYLPGTPEFWDLDVTPNCELVYRKWAKGMANNFSRLFDLHFGLPMMLRRFGPDACLTLGDIGPIRPGCRHVVFVHQAMLVSSDSELAGMGSWSSCKRMYLTRHFAASLNQVSRVIVQTPVMAEHLSRRYHLDRSRIDVIPQPIPEHISSRAGAPGHPVIAACPKPIKLLFLARFYSHKNHGILPAVLDELRVRGLTDTVQIFTTVEEEAVAEVGFLNRMYRQTDLVTNLGLLPMDQVAGALGASSALFLPTLSESYGLIYVEALACGVPILTSDRDFARWMCRDLAHYFDPMDPVSIVDAIVQGASAPVRGYAARAGERLAQLPRDWKELAQAFLSVLRER